jgi:branched-chain amino acid transport system permease protein
MNWLLLAEQLLNGFTLGIILFLLCAGLTLIFGIMDLVNLAHGSLYMMGAYFCATFTAWTGSFVYAIPLALAATFVLGLIVELIVLRSLYTRDHLDQVMATFGLILIFNESVRLIWGPQGEVIPLPPFLGGNFDLAFGIIYPTYRLMIISVGLLVAFFLYAFVTHTRVGMLIRGGASNREMLSALGINVKLLFTVIFGLGAALAGLAGLMAGPIEQATVGMGERILILAFVVIVIGGIGSIRGSFVAAILVGVVDTMGRSFLEDLLSLAMPPTYADTAGPALSSMSIYIVMAAVLAFRPQGLFPPKTR